MLPRSLLQRDRPRADNLIAVPPQLAALAEAQAGVLTRRQLGLCGLTPGRVDAAVRAKRWRTVGRHVVVLSNAPLSELQRHWVAVLLFGKPAALAGLSGAAAAGLKGFEPSRVHVVVSHDTHAGAPGWIQIHESRRFRSGDISEGAGPPRTGIARCLIDAATWSSRPRRACAILCAGVQQRLVTADRLESELRRAGHVRHVAVMRAVLGDIGGGGHTLAEIDLGPVARRAGLPPPRRQVLRRESSGRARYVDAEFDLPDGTTFVVEIDGAVHLQPSSFWDDLDRQNEIVLDGTPVLRFASLSVRLNEQRVVDQLRRMRTAHISCP
ncbi:hypothetical protein [uncultured Jatrophihabitans sp.]|uniref:hypothetical protein n=1 Tax=uncultured Jatrophihabitans sp. TaxID=1610747 RepID=UPI0035CC9AF7